MKWILFFLFFGLTVSAAPLRKAGLGSFVLIWNGRTPPAALVRFEGQSLDDKAYVLGCGHCNSMPVGSYVSNQSTAKKAYLFDGNGDTRGFEVARIVYGTQTVVDLVLLELKLTYRELEAQYGMPARIVARERQPLGTRISFFNLEEIQSCRIDEIHPRYVFNDEGTDYIADAYIYYDCVSLEGHSGSILISQATDQVIGLNVGGSSPERREGHIINFGSTVEPLSKCLDADHRFDLEVPGCTLKIGR